GAINLALHQSVTSPVKDQIIAWFPKAEDCTVPDGAEIRRFQGNGSEVSSVAFSPDGKRVITGASDGIARIWDADTGCGEFLTETKQTV
ncbi:MAG: WD40 repeat domain-containing protein, partial [Pirellulaceae bacterium]